MLKNRAKVKGLQKKPIVSPVPHPARLKSKLLHTRPRISRQNTFHTTLTLASAHRTLPPFYNTSLSFPITSIPSHPLLQSRRRLATPSKPPRKPYYINLDDISSTEASDADLDKYQLIIPNRYTMEDFTLDTTRAERYLGPTNSFLPFGKKKDTLPTIRHISSIESDLELYGGINLQQYNEMVYRPDQGFKNKIDESRTQEDPSLSLGQKNDNNMSNHPNYGDHNGLTSKITTTKDNKTKQSPKEPITAIPGQQQPPTKGSWAKFITSYGNIGSIEKQYSIENTLENNQIPGYKPQFDPQDTRYESNENIIISKSSRSLPPSKQQMTGIDYGIRDIYETQLYLIHRLQQDEELKRTLRQTFKYYTKELDPITGLEACRHLISIELFLYLQTLHRTGIRLPFDNLEGGGDTSSSSSFLKRLFTRGQMSTRDVIHATQQYRTLLMESIINDPTNELLLAYEEEWVHLIHCVTDINISVIRNAKIDKDTAFEMLDILYQFVSSDDYLYDFEDQYNGILIQFSKQFRENWDGDQYNAWKENRLTQLKALEESYAKDEKYDALEQIHNERRRIEAIGDNAEDIEDLQDGEAIDKVCEKLDMPKLKMYINNSLLYYYKTQVFADYGFEDDIGAILMTKALNSLPDMALGYLMDDITEMASRTRFVEWENNTEAEDDNDMERRSDEENEVAERVKEEMGQKARTRLKM